MKKNSLMMFLLLFIPWGCSFNGIATKNDISEVQGNLQARQTNLSEEVLGLKRDTHSLRMELNENSSDATALRKETASNFQAFAQKLDSIERRVNALESKISKIQSDWSQYAAKVDESLKSQAKTNEIQRKTDLSKMDEKLNIVLEEVSKENERILNEIRSMRGAPSSLTGDFHIVKSGESLSRIASLYGVSTQKLADANGITNYNSLRVGQKLKVPKK